MASAAEVHDLAPDTVAPAPSGAGEDLRALLLEPTVLPPRRVGFDLGASGHAHRLRVARRRLAALEGEASTSRGVEWLLDNFYLIVRVLRQLETEFDAAFARRLPVLARDPDGPPRVHRIAVLLFDGGGGFVDVGRAEREVVRAQQGEAFLTLAELWALPVMLRHVALEALVPAVEALPDDGGDVVRDAIQSIRALAQADWTEFVERTSVVERVLRDGDPTGVHARTQFETRNQCRVVVEQIAEWSGRAEVDVAREAVEQARGGTDQRTRHVGYTLLGEGRDRLEDTCGAVLPRGDRLRRAVRSWPTIAYLGSIAALTSLQLAVAVAVMIAVGVSAAWVAVLAAASLLPASTVAVGVTNWWVTHVLSPTVLPKMDFGDGIPADERAVVVVPALLSSNEEVDGLVDQLELHYLSGTDPAFDFALLTDHLDAPEETAEDDAALLARAVAGIEALNARYPDAVHRPFHLFHRRRRYNARMGCWMGWERKRGKLAEFNRVLTGGSDESWIVVGDRERLEGVRYVVTLDADTKLPRDGARQLVETIAHPLNRARVNDGKVTAGYTLLQPRVEITPWSADGSTFARVFSGARGLDPYTRAVSDVYQDLFGEGIFVGKGIYDVDAYESAIGGRVPENSILSHDLFEGIHGRAGLVTDVAMLEEYPATYIEFARRMHRWVRGDWQLLPWLGSTVPMPDGTRAPSPFSTISRWKIVDNLRRSLQPAALLVLLTLCWLALPAVLQPFTLVLALVPLAPALPDFAAATLRRTVLREPPSERGRFHPTGGPWETLARWGVQLALLPHEASVQSDAIVRTVVRIRFTRTRLMEWTTAAAVARQLSHGGPLRLYLQQVWQPPFAAVVGAVLIGVVNPVALPYAAPVLVVWLFAPWLAYRMSQPSDPPVPPPTPTERARLRSLARRTWHFYDRFVGPKDHWLPPDHFQEQPLGAPAHRTSPTNIGLYLLAVVAAWRLGYIGVRVMAIRIRNALDTVAGLPGHRGHLFNWYATDTLEVLLPRYVSSVDSGNLAGSLIVVRHVCRSAARGMTAGGDRDEGFRDALAMLFETVASGGGDAELDGVLAAIEAARSESLPGGVAPDDADARVEAIESALAVVHAEIVALVQRDVLGADAIAGIRDTEQMVAAQLRTMRRDLERGHGRFDVITADDAKELEDIATRADALVANMDFGFLYDPKRRLLRIGYDVGEDRPDPNHYDLLASEARLASLVAIAKGDVPREHWLHLGRPLGRLHRRLSLLSWSGTMFEYLMPPLLLHERGPTLLGQSCRAVVDEQIRFGRSHDVPWGISESGYYHFDTAGAYQYRAFGVPSLGFKRGLGDDLVVAPYASMLAVGISPRSALGNLDALEDLGAVGHYGLFEAIDFTRERIPPGERYAIVRSYMAHHQGMILVALANRLLGDVFVYDFHGDPTVRTAEILLEERPTGLERAERRSKVPDVDAGPPPHARGEPWPADPALRLPELHLLSNGRLTSLVTAAGGGWLSWQGIRVTRWTPDRTLEEPGTVVLVADHDSGLVWPLVPDVGDSVRFEAGSADYTIAGSVAARVRVAVSADDDVEIRKIRLRETGTRARRLRLLLVSDVSLGEGPIERHPAFDKLFVETEYVADPGVLIAHRRQPVGESGPVVGWWATGQSRGLRAAGFETSRERFVGRHGSRLAPRAVWSLRETGHQGVTSPLDPMAVVAVDVELAVGESAQVAFMTGVAESRELLVDLAGRYSSITRVVTSVASSREHAHEELARDGFPSEHVRCAMRLLSAMLFAPTELRAEGALLRRNAGAQSALWRFAISGDLPIVVICLEASEDASIVLEVLRAQALWRRRGFRADVVVLNQRGASYDAALDDRVMRVVTQAGAGSRVGHPGGVFLLHEDRLTPEERDAVLGSARVVLRATAGALSEQLAPLTHAVQVLPDLSASRREPTPPGPHPNPLGDDWHGFSDDGREYLLYLQPGETTPAPWSNVVANDHGGFVITESGGGYSWSLNAGENRLTPWTNDPIEDPPGEVFYLRDEETLDVWSATPRPASSRAPYEVRHGAGYTEFRNIGYGVDQRLRLGMAPDAPVRLARLRLTNASDRPRRITVTWYLEWVLGSDAATSRQHVVPSFVPADEVMLARNPWNTVFGSRVAFAAASKRLHGMTTDRTEFLGRHGHRAAPAALTRVGLSGTVATDRDICSALQVHVDLPIGGTEELVFVLGQGRGRTEAMELARTWRSPDRANEGFAESESRWDDVLGRVEIETPDPAINRLANRWLLYQTISGRLLGRTGFYQSSGAFGFRDQLQDVMALTVVAPDRFRAHVVDAARHQFEEGDVLHWWHPPSDAGVRTRCSDDLIWLPFVAARYVETTGDTSILDEPIPYLAGAELRPDEEDRYAVFGPSDRTEDLYAHCLRALERAEQLGDHGLPLIGAGDWNDGMDRVGSGGKGESVWLGWFLTAALQAFAPVCERRGDVHRADGLRSRAKRLAAAIERHAWDGDWYRRAWFDDGTPLGSSRSEECRIDAISQSWAVISGAGDPERANTALASVREHLVREDDGLVLLLTPPFHATDRDPGYIRSYAPGVRENGGQYTHAAIWTLWALAQAGDPETAVRLFDAISPIAHAARSDAYRVEPYVVAADIYAAPPHTGRGGWTWYTGAAAWSYRFIIEQILGIELRSGELVVTPNLPPSWSGYTATVRVGDTVKRVVVAADGSVEVETA